MTDQTHTNIDSNLAQVTHVLRIFLTEAGRLITIDEAIYNRVKAKVTEALPVLSRDIPYKAEHLYGKEDWKDLPSGERKRFGICISLMVNHGDLPLSRIESKHEYPYYYRLK